MEIPEGFEVVDVPLYEVRHSQTGIVKNFPDGRTIEFYEAEPDQFVLAYVNGQPEWKPVRGFSVHHGCETVIINLVNGLQIVSDHDPRAVVGIGPSSTTFDLQRYYPDEALEKRALVPCAATDHLLPWGDEVYRKEFKDAWEALADKNRLFKAGKNTRLSFDKELGLWVLYNRDHTPDPSVGDRFLETGFEWSGVENLEYTNKVDIGYDLTVPGYETFMSAEGVILSNTMNVSLPSMAESVQEAKDRLMPSKMLMSIKSPDTIVPALKHEQILGLYTAKNSPSRSTHKFATEDEALEALKKARSGTRMIWR